MTPVVFSFSKNNVFHYSGGNVLIVWGNTLANLSHIC